MIDFKRFIKYIDEQNINDLPHPYKEIAEALGIETALVLAENYSGRAIYFPKIERALQAIRNKRIAKDFNGGNVTYLAKKYNLTESWIREILRAQHINENQLKLFG